MQIHHLYQGNHFVIVHNTEDAICITIRDAPNHNQELGSWDMKTKEELPLFQEGDTVLKFNSPEALTAFADVVLVGLRRFAECQTTLPAPSV